MYADAPIAELPPEAILHQLIGGAMVTQMLAQAARLGVADHLEAGPLGIDELSHRIDTHPDSLYRMMRALASLGVFKENSDASFELTPIGSLLRDGEAGSLRMWAMMCGTHWYWETMGHARYTLATGRPAFDELYGKGPFQYFHDEPEAGALFYDTMTRFSNELIPHILSNYDFSTYKHLIDVGGGHGALLSSILATNPTLKGTLFDMPFVIDAVAGHYLPSEPPFVCVKGDFFKSVPEGGDCYLLKYILHDWSDEQAKGILRNCRKAMSNDGRVLVFDHVIRAPNEPCPGKMLDLTMLLMLSGRERNETEFATLFERAGLRLSKTTPVIGSFCVLEGVPV